MALSALFIFSSHLSSVQADKIVPAFMLQITNTNHSFRASAAAAAFLLLPLLHP